MKKNLLISFALLFLYVNQAQADINAMQSSANEDSFATEADDWDTDDRDTDDWDTDDSWAEEPKGLLFTGFIEGAYGTRLKSDSKISKNETLNEIRARIETSHDFDDFKFSLKVDAAYDQVIEKWDLEIRDLTLSGSLSENLDIKIGRQILTWGTGDLVFLNDLFAKDWQSFFSGREDPYLKAPSNSLKLSYFNELANIDFIFTPRENFDNYINGERFSFYNPMNLSQGFEASEPKKAELALRVYGDIDQLEWALYGYSGYSKSPDAFIDGKPAFYKMNSFGGSISKPIAGGLANFEFSYYDSLDDKAGTNPLIPNSQWRGLVAYEHELISKLTMSTQYYIEHFVKNDIEGTEPTRDLITIRLTYKAFQDKLNLSLFSFYSPMDQDAYLRPVATYRINDTWSSTLGANLFMGKNKTSFFGQFTEASNLYVRLRYSF